jgi:hypothetical protein
MVRLEYIAYSHGGKVVKFKPVGMVLPIKATKNGYLPAELKIRPTQLSRYTKYKLGKKEKMLTPKCRCAVCSCLVTNWIGDKCTRCYNAEVTNPVILKYDRMLLQEGTSHLKEVTRLREVELENNRFWASLVKSYRDRFEVRMVDKAKYYFWYVRNFFSNVRLLILLGVAMAVGFVQPSWAKK